MARGFRTVSGIMTNAPLTVHELRRRWKPQKERLHDLDADHPNPVRFHRACSWLQRVEQLRVNNERDLALLGQWIALNALYGQWDERAREPVGDQACLRIFFDRILALDVEGQVKGVLVQQKRLVMTILDDEYLSRFFWQEPCRKRAGQSKKVKYDAQTWYQQDNWTLLLDRLVERIYLLRCQLVHGASTYNSSLNRVTLGRCITMMGHLLPAVLLVWIDHGADEDWGKMCYPPLREAIVMRR